MKKPHAVGRSASGLLALDTHPGSSAGSHTYSMKSFRDWIEHRAEEPLSAPNLALANARSGWRGCPGRVSKGLLVSGVLGGCPEGAGDGGAGDGCAEKRGEGLSGDDVRGGGGWRVAGWLRGAEVPRPQLRRVGAWLAVHPPATRADPVVPSRERRPPPRHNFVRETFRLPGSRLPPSALPAPGRRSCGQATRMGYILLPCCPPFCSAVYHHE